jgi:hypothetical protein
MYTVNIWAILVASVVSFGIGALWYSPILFGKEWMALSKISDKDIGDAQSKGMWKHYVIHFIFTVITFCVLAFIASATGLKTSGDGAFIAFVAWLGFILPGSVSELLWKKTPFKLVLIDSMNVLISLIIGGAIIGSWLK